MSAMATARHIAADAVQAVGDNAGAAAGKFAAVSTVAAVGAKTGGLGALAAGAVAPMIESTVRGVAASITDRATEAVRGETDNPLNTTF